MAKKENDTFKVQINLVFILKAKDEMDAQDKVTRAAAMLRPAGTESRTIKWIDTKGMIKWINVPAAKGMENLNDQR